MIRWLAKLADLKTLYSECPV